jgi:hypothetical protein
MMEEKKVEVRIPKNSKDLRVLECWASTVEGWGMEEWNRNAWWGYPLGRGKKYVLDDGVLVAVVDEYVDVVVVNLFRVDSSVDGGLRLLGVYESVDWIGFIEFVKSHKGGV